jgi:hypothetical protein
MMHIERDQRSTRPREAGIALLAAVLLLLMLASIGLASLNVVERDQQVAGYLNRKAMALHAADAAVARALASMSGGGAPNVPTTTMGDVGLYPGGRPSYRTDTTAAEPIEKVGPPSSVAGMGLTGAQGGSGSAIQAQYWRIRVQGEAPGGSIARVEVLTRALVTN